MTQCNATEYERFTGLTKTVATSCLNTTIHAHMLQLYFFSSVPVHVLSTRGISPKRRDSNLYLLVGTCSDGVYRRTWRFNIRTQHAVLSKITKFSQYRHIMQQELFCPHKAFKSADERRVQRFCVHIYKHHACFSISSLAQVLSLTQF